MQLFVSLSRRKWKGLQNSGAHAPDQGDGIGHDFVPALVMPSVFSAAFTVSQVRVAPNVVDGVESSKLREETGIGNVWSNSLTALNTFGPVISPIVHAARLDAVAADVVDVVPASFVRDGPVGERLEKFTGLTIHQLPARSFTGHELLIVLQQQPSLVNVRPALWVANEIHCSEVDVTIDEFPACHELTMRL